MTESAGQDLAAGRKQRRILRLRQVLVELDREPAGLEWGELWRRLIEVVPLTDDDLEENRSGTLRGETDTRFQRQYLDKAGWVLTGVGRMRITEAGRAALRAHEDAASLLRRRRAGLQGLGSTASGPGLVSGCARHRRDRILARR